MNSLLWTVYTNTTHLQIESYIRYIKKIYYYTEDRAEDSGSFLVSQS